MVLCLSLGLPLLAACSLAFNQEKDQCKTDGDCASIGVAFVCRAGICGAAGTPQPTASTTDTVPPISSSAAPCATPAPTCPNNICVPFDNCARLGICDGAALPALVAPPKP